MPRYQLQSNVHPEHDAELSEVVAIKVASAWSGWIDVQLDAIVVGQPGVRDLSVEHLGAEVDRMADDEWLWHQLGGRIRLGERAARQ
jgi:hypothetical protein